MRKTPPKLPAETVYHPVKYRKAMLAMKLADLEKRRGSFPESRKTEISEAINALKYKIGRCDELLNQNNRLGDQ